jgi:hypothetical protein
MEPYWLTGMRVLKTSVEPKSRVESRSDGGGNLISTGWLGGTCTGVSLVYGAMFLYCINGVRDGDADE